MKDLVFGGETVALALAAATDALGLAPEALRYVVLEPGQPPQGHSSGTPARIVVLAGGGAPAAASPPSRPAGDRIERVTATLREALGVSIARSADDKGEAIAVSAEPGIQPWGRTGEVFRALEHLLGRIGASDETSRPTRVISKDYRAWRDARLEEEAQFLADEVAADGKRRAFPRLNAYERRVVHLALAGHEHVATRSVGDGDERELWIESRSRDEA